jgi:hypothetical protein
MQVFNQKLQVKFDFGFGPMIFDRVFLLELRNNINKKTFSAQTFVGLYNQCMSE